MKFSDIQNARIAGVFTGLAVGDALGAGYEFDPPMADSVPVRMIGGGLGGPRASGRMTRPWRWSSPRR